MKKFLNPITIKEDYPKSYKALEEWLSKHFDDPAIPEQIRSQFSTENLVTSALTYGYRMLYEFFDQNEVYVHVGKGNRNFGYGIGHAEYKFFETEFTTRQEVEIVAFETAFKELEVMLNESN